MLLNLTIIDLAIVKSLNLDLHVGMSVLTGETGAGKSILLTALGLALGNRADSGFVRPGCQRAEINLEFNLSDAPSAQTWLEQNEMNLEDNLTCLIRRVILHDGGSKAYINSRPVTLQSLKELSSQLVEIHGQHAHLTLLNSEQQARLLDNFGKNQPLLNKLNAVFTQWKQTNNQLKQLIQASEDKVEREEILRFQIEELEQLDLSNFDYTAINEEHTQLANMGEIFSEGQKLLDLLYENEQQSVNQLLNHSVSAMADLSRYSSRLSDIEKLLAEAQIQVEESAQELRRYLESQEADPARLTYLEQQIGIIQDISRKHQVEPGQLPELAVQLAEELDNISHSQEKIEVLRQETKKFLTQYRELSQKLSQKRQAQATELQKRISEMIKELGMPQGEFTVRLTREEEEPIKPRFNGNDRIEFLVSANPGLPAKPLAKVASGGELSRISLAIQVTTSTDKTTPTMIFDEVDSGIGGGIAEIVGQKLCRLSQNRQIICVTHLPQVASQAHQHLFVKKDQTETTSSTVILLEEKQRIEEVARMLGGVNMTENTLAHAREMLGLSS